MIDFHTHPVLVRELVEKYPRFERAAREVFYIGNNFQPLETFLLQMDVAGIERAVLLPVDCRRARQDAVGTNQQIAELCALSARFIGFASVDPRVKTAAKDLARAVKTLHLEGLKLDPALQDFDSAGAQALAVYEAAEELKIPVLLHAGMSWAPGSAIAPGHPLRLEPAIRRFAKLNFVLAHFAWPWVWEAVALAMKYPNVFLDTSCLYYDSPKEFFEFVFTRQIPVSLIERTLANQVVFGSNYPRVEIKNMVRALKSLPLTEGCLNKILRENARRLLGQRGKRPATSGRDH